MLDLPLFYAPSVEQDGLLPSEEAGHALRVLRMTEGNRLLVTNGLGSVWLATIVSIDKQACRVKLDEHYPWEAYWQGKINIYVAPTKSIERMEWLIEKAVEIGVDSINLIKCTHSERKHINKDRLQKIILSAMKQSQKGILPKLTIDVPFKDAIKEARGSKLIFHCRTSNSTKILVERILPHHYLQTKTEGVNLFIGPEGDFSVEEIVWAQELGALPATLGASRLRTETAALVALQWVHTLQSISSQ